MQKTNWIKIFFIVLLSALTLFIPFDSFGVHINPIEQRVIALFVLAALSWIFEPFPIWSTSVLVIVLMIFTVSDKAPAMLLLDDGGSKFGNLLSYKALMATFADPTIMLFLGGFFLAAAATKFQLDFNLARVLLRPFGKKPHFVLLGLMLVTAIFSMFMSNTATAAMMLAILAPVLAIFDKEDKGRIAFALAIPIGANIGGIGTPIGTPPNAIVVKALAEMHVPISFAKWMFFAVPCMLVMIVIAWFILLKLFPISKKSMELKIENRFLKTPSAFIVYITFATTVILWMLGDVLGLDSNTIAMIPIAVFSITRVISKDDLNKMSWDVLWLVAGGFALGLGIQKTGLASHLLEAIPFASWPSLMVLVGASFIGVFMSTFMSNTASASLLAPIIAALGVSMGAGIDSLGGVQGLLIAVALSCSFAMSLPISTPPNALAYSTGFVRTKDMAKMGVLVGIVGLLIVFAMMSFLGNIGYFSKSKDVLQVSPVVTEENVKEGIKDLAAPTPLIQIIEVEKKEKTLEIRLEVPLDMPADEVLKIPVNADSKSLDSESITEPKIDAEPEKTEAVPEVAPAKPAPAKAPEAAPASPAPAKAPEAAPASPAPAKAPEAAPAKPAPAKAPEVAPAKPAPAN